MSPKSLTKSATRKKIRRTRKARKQHGWYRKSTYGHFDKPLSLEEATLLVKDPVAVAQHKFLPFLRSVSTMRKLARAKVGKKRKERPLAYASHEAALIFAYYNHLVGTEYEKLLAVSPANASVLAYRSIDDGAGGSQCNIHFAKQAIDEIRKQGNCVAVACDLSDFFETIGHAELLKQWKRILGVETLSADQFAVFDAITSYRVVELEKAKAALGSYPTNTRWWASMKIIREKVMDADLAERPPFEGHPKGTVRKFGIPQGSPISGLLANVVMFSFDEHMVAWAKAHGGRYWRYSDDILWVGPIGTETAFQKELDNHIHMGGARLKLNAGKTEVTTFTSLPNGTQKAVLIKDGLRYRNGWLQYLGFVYTGKAVLIRNSSLAKYMRRMKGGIGAAFGRTITRPRKDHEGKVFERGLWKSYAYNSLSKQMTFPKYVHKCAEIFGGSDARAMKKQVGKAPKILKQGLDVNKRVDLKIKRSYNHQVKKDKQALMVANAARRPKRISGSIIGDNQGQFLGQVPKSN